MSDSTLFVVEDSRDYGVSISRPGESYLGTGQRGPSLRKGVIVAALVVTGNLSSVSATSSAGPFPGSMECFTQALPMPWEPEIQSTWLEQMLEKSAAEQLKEVLTTFSINKSRLAEWLDITRPTLYSWMNGNEPAGNESKTALKQILQLMESANVSSSEPLNRRFMRKIVDPEHPSLEDYLSQPTYDFHTALGIAEKVRNLTNQAHSQLLAKKQKMIDLGYNELSGDEKLHYLDILMLKRFA